MWDELIEEFSKNVLGGTLYFGPLIEKLTQLYEESVKLVDEINSMYNPHGGFF